MIFAPTELKVRPKVNTLNVTWQPSPNHTLVSGYKLSYQEAEADESSSGKRLTHTHTIRLRKKARHHLLTGLGKLLAEFYQRNTATHLFHECWHLCSITRFHLFKSTKMKQLVEELRSYFIFTIVQIKEQIVKTSWSLIMFSLFQFLTGNIR